MFQSARLKLTAWYLLIIMCVSVSFSVVIYRMLTLEVERFARLQRSRIERRFEIDVPVPPSAFPNFSVPPSTFVDESLIVEVDQHILLILGAVNLGVLVVAGGLGYFLAGRTLRPIQDMMDEQHRFISDASHELRTPLTALKSSLEVNIRDPKLTIKDAKTLMKESVEDVNKLQSLSDALLTLAQYEKPAVNIAFRRAQLTVIIASALKKTTPMAKQKHITVTDRTKPFTVEADESSLTDVFVILLDNAIKYSPNDSEITVTSKRTDSTADITVADHGRGIKPKDLPHIFDRFYRADSSRMKERAGGYGLGLSIAKKIAEMHHGSISVVSAPGRGSAFTVRLPVKQAGKMA